MRPQGTPTATAFVAYLAAVLKYLARYLMEEGFILDDNPRGAVRFWYGRQAWQQALGWRVTVLPQSGSPSRKWG